MSSKKPALGRGLDAFFAGSAAGIMTPLPSSTAEVRQVPLDEIRANPYQPRSQFDREKLQELADSIKARGVLQPIVLRRSEEGYELVAGERRWRAAQMAGLERVPAMVREYDDRTMLEAALIENLQRDDLGPLEEARAYARLVSEFETTQDELAKAIGKSRVAVTNALRLLKLPTRVQEMLDSGELTAGHGRALLGLDEDGERVSLAKRIVSGGLSVREVEDLVKARHSAQLTHPKPGRLEARDDVSELQDKFTDRLGVKVKIRPASNTSGRIEIYYGSLDDFQRICEFVGVNLDEAREELG